MQDSGLAGCGLLVFQIIFFFVTGTITYNIVEPHSFIGILVFLVSWAVVQAIGMILIAVVFGGIAALLSRE